ncbi:hypothetical protein PG993_000098 [Apiospora rasikravindrae]|uniref:Uncharacterized protein n=1 Tax=Apiospora rasikravindrae TaxID=990691 RepID=A0ABR1U7J1_9PEZI
MTIPVLWWQPCQTGADPCLNRLFRNIAPARRNLYAQHVELGTVQTFRKIAQVARRESARDYSDLEREILEEEAIENVLSEVDFPKMEFLAIRDSAGNHLPQLGCQDVKVVLLDPNIIKASDQSVTVKCIEPVLEQLPALFPDLEKIETICAYPNVVSSLKQFKMTAREPLPQRSSDVPASGGNWGTCYFIYRPNQSTLVYRDPPRSVTTLSLGA